MPKLKIEIDEKEFLQKTVKEQNLVMFQKLCAIDQSGCSWARKYNKGQTKKLYTIGAVAGLVGGFLAMLSKLAFWK